MVLDSTQERLVSGKPGDWSKYADLQDTDGLQAYVTREKLFSLVVKTGNPFQVLTPPEPALFFSFSRSRSLLLFDEHVTREEWLFSVYGYLLPEYRVYLTVLPSHSEYQCESRTTPFVIL